MKILKETVGMEDRTLANLIWRKFGKQPEGFIEKVMEINPAIADAVHVPVGTEISFPVDELSVVPKKDLVRLWD